MRNKAFTGVAVLTGLVLLVFMFWYSGGEEPLSAEEVDQLIGQIQSQTQKPGGQHDITALRQFLSEDDGQPFYTVNLYKYYDQAQYPHDWDVTAAPKVSGRHAYNRFSQVMVKLLAKQASHPIFGSDWMDNNTQQWDRLVIVRYRSRRDIAQIFASDEFVQASSHKWAGLEKNQRLLVQGLHIPELFLIAMLILVGLVAVALYRVFSQFSEKRRVST